MGRTAAVALAIAAVLATTATSRAATVTYDLSGLSSYRLADAFVPPYTEVPAASGSSLTLDFDANGDGNSGDVTIVDGTLLVRGTVWVGGAYGSIDADLVLSLSGGLGQASTHAILWSTPASYVIGGTASCSGEVCGLLGWQPGTPHSYTDLLASQYITVSTSLDLQMWYLAPDRRSFAFCPTDTGDPYPPCFGSIPTSVSTQSPGSMADAIVLAGAVPEPARVLLFAPALFALALRPRASGTMRRHETD